MFNKVDLFNKMRLEKRVSQNEIAKVLGVSSSYISKVENGKNEYSLEQMQILMKTYGIDSLKIRTNGIVNVINERYKNVVLDNEYSEELYFKGKTLNDIITSIRNHKSLTQEQFSSFVNVSQTTVSSWETNQRSVGLDMFFGVLDKFNVSVVYITQEDIIVPKNDESEILKDDNLYKLAKICCETVRKDNPLYSDILGDLGDIDKISVPYHIYYAKTPLESAYKMIEINPNVFLDDFVDQNLLSGDSMLNDMYDLIDKNPSIFEDVLSKSFYAYSRYKFGGEGLYLNFGDGGYDTLKVSTIIDKMKNGDFESWSETIDISELDITLVDKVYNALLKSIY